MEIKLENLDLIPEILEKLKIIEQRLDASGTKRWLNVEETSHYIGYSKDRIYNLKSEVFIEGIHYHKKGKLLFDRYELDKWIMGDNRSNKNSKKIVDDLMASVLKKHQ